MKTIPGVLTGLLLVVAAAPATAQHAGGFHGGAGGFHGGGFHGGGFHGGHSHGGHFHGAPFWGYGLGLGFGYGYGYWGYPGYSYEYSSSTYAYRNGGAFSLPNGPVQPDPTCGTWIWHPETYSYGWLACGATSEINVPMGAPPAPASSPP